MRLRFSPGNYDPIGHGGVAYAISNSPAGLGLYEVEVPDAVGHVLLATSTGAVRIDEPPVEEQMHPIRMRHPEGATITWRGHAFAPEPDGVTFIPAAAIEDALSHGFRIVEED